MAEPQYNILPMSRDDLDTAIAWAAAEGWNPGLYDAKSFFAADPSGYWMGVLEGEPIASISAVKYGETFGFIGFYIVKPEYRGRGYGYALWQAGLASLAGRAIGLDGVVEQQPIYIKSGFKLAHRNIRYAGVTGGDRPSSEISSRLESACSLVPLSAIAIPRILEYDRAFFPTERTAFLQHWIVQPHSHALGVVRDGILQGYGVIRPCQIGYKIGPLFADSAPIADAIFYHLISTVEADRPFYLDVPEINPDAVHLAESHDMRVVFETARMYAHSLPDLSLSRTFGVTTFELG
ncbi:MAG: GNAT family N-acetyltransferase [Cyanobacteria bacterium J06639_1]